MSCLNSFNSNYWDLPSALLILLDHQVVKLANKLVVNRSLTPVAFGCMSRVPDLTVLLEALNEGQMETMIFIAGKVFNLQKISKMSILSKFQKLLGSTEADYQEAFKAWRLSLPKGAKASHADFKLTSTFLTGNYPSTKSASSPTTETSKIATLTICSFGNKQHLILLLECPPFHV